MHAVEDDITAVPHKRRSEQLEAGFLNFTQSSEAGIDGWTVRKLSGPRT
jgi:hypothetical protein